MNYESFTFRLRRKIGEFLFNLSCFVSPSLHQTYQNFGHRLFFKKEMKKSFPWQQYIHKKSLYFKNWGFDVSMLDAEYYGSISGKKADYYVTRSMAMHYIYPYLDRYEFLPAYMDKNFQKRALDLKSAKKEIDILATEDIVTNSNGLYYNAEDQIISFEEALENLLSYGKDMILKPSVDSYGGAGVIKIPAGINKVDLKAIIEKYHYNFTFQRVVEQHPTLAAFNPSSVNTIRMVTYRNPSKKTKILYSCIRFGGVGTITDNVCSGGGYTGIGNDGKLIDRKKYSYFTLEAPQLPESFPNEIPCWEKIQTAALFLHSRLPHFDIVGWDFSVTPDGHPLLIEYNLRPGVGLQQAIGPMFSRDELDELMQHVSKYRIKNRSLGVISFKDLPKKPTVHFMFGR